MKLNGASVDEIIKDPTQVYANPQEVMRDPALTTEEKKKILKSWEEDVEALLRAEGENMPPPEKTQKTGDLLASISNLKKKLG